MKLINLGPAIAPLLGGSASAMAAMGIMDFMEEEDEDGDEGGGDLFDDGDEFGGMNDGGMGGGGMGGDRIDDWGDDGGADFGRMGGDGGGAATQELEKRLEDLENEVGDISSTVSTVRSENEQISEKVDDVEENVRKLLEIYEMVTRGVNPFVDDVPNGDAFGGGEAGGFGLFDEDEADDATDEDLDEDVADADAESFFDDTFDDVDEQEDTMDEFDEDMDDTDDGQAGGSTFQELKEEYESGEADWADAGTDAEAADGAEPMGDDFEMGSMDGEFEPVDDPEPIEDSDSEPAEGSNSERAMDDGEFEFEDPEQTVESQAAETTVSMRSGKDKPYLATLPNGYVIDLVVMEWLEFLVSEFGSEDTVRTIGYYEEIDWISEPVREELLTYVQGIADVADVDAAAAPATLSVDDHLQSLTFMSQLTGDALERQLVDHCARIRGEGHGLQR